MRALFVTVQPFIPQTAGGAQTSTDELANEIVSQGHVAAVLAGMNAQGWIGWRNRFLMKALNIKAPSDVTLGYRTYRAWFPNDVVGHVVAKFRPDVAVLSTWRAIPVAKSLESANVPVVIYLRDVEFDDLGGDPRTLRDASYIANSEFTASSYKRVYGISAAVVPPLFHPERYRIATNRRCVTFVNPHGKKGVDIAMALAAACPDIPFLFVEGWALAPAERAGLMTALGSRPNVTWMPRTQDMRTVYSQTRILLAPSRWEEAWCRVVSEAQYSGIPALASTRGGLPESVGPGGCLVDADAPIDTWVQTLRRMWDDSSFYAAKSQAALEHAGSSGLDRLTQIKTVLGVLSNAAASNRRAERPSPEIALA